jgi:hypothetical protein
MIEYLDLYPDGDKNSPLPLPTVPRPTRYMSGKHKIQQNMRCYALFLFKF